MKTSNASINSITDSLFDAAMSAVENNVPVNDVQCIFEEGWYEAIDQHAKNLKEEAKRRFKR